MDDFDAVYPRHYDTVEEAGEALDTCGEEVPAADYLGEHGGDQALQLLWDAVEDEDEDEEIKREAAASSLARRRGPWVAAHGSEQADSSRWSIREATARVIGLVGGAGLTDEDTRPDWLDSIEETLLALFSDSDEDVRAAALKGLGQVEHEEAAELARGALGDYRWEVRLQAVRTLHALGNTEDVSNLEGRLGDRDEDVRLASLEALAELAPGRRIELAAQCMRDSHEKVSTMAMDILNTTLPDDDLVKRALESLPRVTGSSGAALLQVVRDKAPDRLRGALMAASQSGSWQVRQQAAEGLATDGSHRALDRLRAMQTDSDEDVRRAVLNGLCDNVPDEARNLAIGALQDRHTKVQLAGLEKLEDDEDPYLVDDLLPLARDPDEEVRLAVLPRLAKYDDDRVLAELISSLNDVDHQVKARARELLEGSEGPLPVLQRMDPIQTSIPLWQRLEDHVAEINHWAQRAGQELLGRRVVVEQYRQGIGRTRVARDNFVHIEVSDAPITSGHRYGDAIMRAIALHEIGHHLCDIGMRGHRAMRGIAHSEGLGEIFDILLDERLERVMRSRRHWWGRYFDRLASYAFAQNAHALPLEHYAALCDLPADEAWDKVVSGELPGRPLPLERTRGERKVSMRDVDMLGIPGLLPPLQAWLWGLRCGFDPALHPNAAVHEALAEVPRNLKDLPHSEVLKVARAVAEHIGRSPQHKKDMQRMLQRMRRHREAMRSLARLLNRMADAGRLDPSALPKWMRQDAPGIRRQPDEPPPPTTRIMPWRLHRESGPKLPGGQGLNLGEELEFDRLPKEQALTAEAEATAALVASIRRHIRVLRAYLERLGTRTIDEYASRRGRRLDMAQARRAPFLPTPDLLVHSRDEILPDAYIGILIDRSGSMDGKKMGMARAFGCLVAEAARGLRGIEGHVNAFDDDTIYRLGDFRRHDIAALQAGGGNNDAGGLQFAADLALHSHKSNRLLIMISDGHPTECTVEALTGLVQRLTREYDIVCTQVVVDNMENICFPHFVDLSRFGMDEATALFGRMLIRLTRGWR